jgi:exodeoxyribonuclease VII small subunit
MARKATPNSAASTAKEAVAAAPPDDRPEGKEGDEIACSLSFREAQTALELCLAQLQSSDLDVEHMAGLYRRAESYAARCEQLLDLVEQDVMQWDPEVVSAAPRPLKD